MLLTVRHTHGPRVREQTAGKHAYEQTKNTLWIKQMFTGTQTLSLVREQSVLVNAEL
jgi:hypothetical protein